MDENQKKPDERRRQVRLSKSLLVSYREVKDYIKTGSRSIDISRGGIRLPTPRNFRVGTTLKLEISAPNNSGKLSLTGEVAWTRKTSGGRFPFEMGLRFIDISREQLPMLARICRRSSGGVAWLG